MPTTAETERVCAVAGGRPRSTDIGPGIAPWRRIIAAALLLVACARPPAHAAAEPSGTPATPSRSTATPGTPTPAATPAQPRPTAANQLGPVQPRRVVFHDEDPDRLLVMDARLLIAVWNVADPKRPFKEIALATLADDVAFAPDGRSLVTANQDGSVHGWDVYGNEAWTVKPDGDGALRAVATSSHPPLIAVGGFGGKIYLLGPDGAARATLAGHDGVVLSLAFSPDGEWLASDGSDTVVRLWKRKKGGGYEPSKTFRTPSRRYQKMLPNLIRLDVQWGWGETVAFSPDGRLLVSANLDGTAQIWNRDGAPHTRPFTDHAGQHVRAVAYSPRGDLVASAGFDGTVRLWKPDGSAYRPRPAVRHGDVISSVSFSADGRRLATAGLDNHVVISQVGGTRLAVLPQGKPPALPAPHRRPTPAPTPGDTPKSPRAAR